MKLYEISSEYLTALRELDELSEQGIVTAEVVADTLEGMAGEWADKALNVAKYIATLDAEAAALKEVEQRKAAQRKALENRADGLRRYLLVECQRTGLTPKDAEISISLRKSQAVVIDSEADLPDDYKREIPASFQPDKTLIKNAIADGYTVPGAHLEIRQSLTIK